MNIDVALLPACLDELDLSSKTVVVVDILRATSTMIAAFEKGACRILPVETVETALALSHKTAHSILVGEISSVRPAEFDYDNSPVALQNAGDIAGRTVIMRSTNGTRLLKQLQKRHVPLAWIGSFLNINALVHRYHHNPKPMLICCAGDSGRISLEDTGFAGALVKMILAEAPAQATLTDSATMALNVWENMGGNIETLFAHATHAQTLRQLNQQADLDYIAHTDSPLVPIFNGDTGEIDLIHNPQAAESLI